MWKMKELGTRDLALVIYHWRSYRAAMTATPQKVLKMNCNDIQLSYMFQYWWK